MDYRGIMRMKLLEEIYDKMSPEDKRTFVQLSMQDKSSEEILQALQKQENHIVDINEKVSRKTWLSDFSSNIAGNAVWDGLAWISSHLLRRL